MRPLDQNLVTGKVFKGLRLAVPACTLAGILHGRAAFGNRAAVLLPTEKGPFSPGGHATSGGLKKVHRTLHHLRLTQKSSQGQVI